ncbi:MAG: hypothetical protein KI793_09765 [Rivularia sp. (in: Bacteria)]|nr:hypothetical protein [Rivularia sp. MS3]
MKRLINVLVFSSFSTFLISSNNITESVSETLANPATTKNDINITPSVSVSDQAVQNGGVTVAQRPEKVGLLFIKAPATVR